MRSAGGARLRIAGLLVGAVMLGTAVGLAAAADAAALQGVLVSLLIAFLLMAHLAQRRDQGWANGLWGQYLAVAVVIRLMAGFFHLFLAFYVFNQMVDFVGLHDWVERIVEGFLVASIRGPETFGFVESGAVALLMAPLYLFVGPGLVGMVLVSSLLGFIGSYLFLRSFQIVALPDGDVPFLGKVLFFLPSFVFWGSLFGKDSMVFFGLGALTYCVARLSRSFQIGPAVGVVTFLGLITAVRPHVAVPLAVSIGLAWLMSRPTTHGAGALLAPVSITGRVLAMAAAIAVPAALLTSMYNFMSLPHLFSEIARRHQALSSAAEFDTGLGSSLPPRITGDSPWELLAYLPEGIATFLFRPLPFDAHNTQALLASAEGTLILAIVVMRWRRLGHALRGVWSSPYLFFCVTYFFLGTIVLCFERNLGLIARHRIMTLPFLMIMLAVPLVKRAPRVADNGVMVGASAAGASIREGRGRDW